MLRNPWLYALLALLLNSCVNGHVKSSSETETSEPAHKTAENLFDFSAFFIPWNEYGAPSEEGPPSKPGESAETSAVSPNFWFRLGQNFNLGQNNHPHIEREKRFLLNSPRFITRSGDNARPFIYHVLEEVEKRGLPNELALLPVLESSYYPHAQSPYGAVGIWQLTAGTARHLGLKQSRWYDGRKDVVASTDAALNYLEYLHQQLGEWDLAIAAYNCGLGTIQNAVRKNRQAGLPVDFWSLDLPDETRRFVPRLYALRDLILSADPYGLDLPEIANEPMIEQITLDNPLDLKVAAQLTNTPEDELARLNPGLTRRATDPEGPYTLTLPAGKGNHLENGLNLIPRSSWMHASAPPASPLRASGPAVKTSKAQSSGKATPKASTTGKATPTDKPGKGAKSKPAGHRAPARPPARKPEPAVKKQHTEPHKGHGPKAKPRDAKPKH